MSLIHCFNGETREQDKGMKGIKEKKEVVKDEHFLWTFPSVSYKCKRAESIEGTQKKHEGICFKKRHLSKSILTRCDFGTGFGLNLSKFTFIPHGRY
jgi:hypothetical protein